MRFVVGHAEGVEGVEEGLRRGAEAVGLLPGGEGED